MKARFILNPCSGHNARRPRLAHFIGEFIRRHELDATVVTTKAAGHATALAREAIIDGCDRVVAVGGDGTMNEVGQALLHTNSALALVACGSGNGLARHLGIPRSLEQALKCAVADTSAVIAIDSGIANGHPFFNAMGCGFDAEISRRFNRLRRRGLPAYARTGLAAFWQHRSERVRIRTEEKTLSLDMLLTAVANSDQYGNGARIAPGAQVTDGELNLVAVRPLSVFAALPLIARLFLGKIEGSDRVVNLCGPHFTIERSSCGLIHTDGETHETGAIVEINVCPKSLRLVVPITSRVNVPANLRPALELPLT
jgi:diacylglycerol kinase (ATP)